MSEKKVSGFDFLWCALYACAAFPLEILLQFVEKQMGIDIKGSAGCAAKACYAGTVSSIFQYAGRYIVMIRHGKYISVYSGLSSVSVGNGSKVSTGQSLGTVGKDETGNYVLHFQLRKESSRLNPEQWVR